MKRLYSFLAAAMAVLCLVVSTSAPALAASSGLSITPRKNLTVKPGESVTDKLVINNLDPKATLALQLRVVDFTFLNNTGAPKLMLDQNAPQTVWSIKPFLKAPDTVVIEPGKTKTINYTVKVPAGQGAGSYYSAIVYAAAGDANGQVNLSASGVSLVFVSVPGTVKQDLTLEKLGAYQEHVNVAGGSYTFINTNKPREIGFTLKNNGNVAESPSGSITLRRTFSSKEIQIDNVNPNGSLALRGQSRLFTACIELEEKEVKVGGRESNAVQCASPSLLPGRYSVKLDLVYGQNGNLTHELAGTASFWYLPWWFVGAVLAVIALIAYAVWRVVRRIKGATRGTPYKKRRRR